MPSELPPAVVEHWQIVLSLGARITEAFRSKEAAESMDPAIWIFLHLDPPAIEVVERLQITAQAAIRKTTFGNPKLTPDASERIVVISNDTSTFIYHVPDPRVHPDWYE